MGIKDLYTVIKLVAPDHITSYHLSELTGTRFSVDISIFLYKYIRTAGDKGWMNMFILFLCSLKKHGIKAVCIFDGPNPPIEKRQEQQRRRAENARSIERLKECIRIRNKLQDEYFPLDTCPEPSLIDQCKKLISVRKGYPDATNYYDIGDVVDSLNSTIERLERQTLPITKKHKDAAFRIVKMFGLTAIEAEGEAETLCAYLAVKGLVDAVLTEDTDVLPYGTPLMVAYKDFKLRDEKVYVINLPELLDEMKMNQDEFRDLCILLSCDYNTRARGFPPDGRKRKKSVGIGVKGALCMIQEYRRLEEVCKHVEDPSCLKYRRCRELFTIPKDIPDGLVPYNKPVDYESLAKFLKDNSVTINIDYISKCCKPAELIFDSDSSSDEDSLFSSSDDEN